MDAIWTPGPLPRLLDSEFDPNSGDFLRLESTDYVAFGDSRALTRAVIWPSIFLLLDEEFGFLYRDAPILPEPQGCETTRELVAGRGRRRDVAWRSVDRSLIRELQNDPPR